MQLPTRPLLVLHPDERFRARVRHGIRGRMRMQEYAGWAALADAVAVAQPTAVVLVDPFYGRGESAGPAPELQILLGEYPSSTVVGVMTDGLREYRDFWTLSRWGVCDVIHLGEDDTPLALGRRLCSMPVRPVQYLLDNLELAGAGMARVLIEAAAEVAARGGHARDLARALSLSRASLLRRCHRSRLPPPRRLLLWLRALHAGALLDDPGHTISSAALACGYTSDTTLRRALRTLVPQTPSTLRSRGAFRTLAEVFHTELRAPQRQERVPTTTLR